MAYDGTTFAESAPKRGEHRQKVPTQAQILTARQFEHLLRIAKRSEHPVRALVGVYLSYFAALRAHEIALLEWSRHVLDASGNVRDVLTITDDIGKKNIGRQVPLNPDLRAALIQLRALRPHDKYVFHPVIAGTREDHVSPSAVCKFFKRLYEECGFEGASSHSGRRTFITNKGRSCNTVGTSLRDVQLIVGHASLVTTQGYIEPSMHQHRLVELDLFHGQRTSR